MRLRKLFYLLFYRFRPICQSACRRAAGGVEAAADGRLHQNGPCFRLARSTIGQPLLIFGVALPFHDDPGSGALDIAQIVRRQFDGGCADVLLQTVQLGGSGDGNDPRPLRQQSGQRDLRRPGCWRAAMALSMDHSRRSCSPDQWRLPPGCCCQVYASALQVATHVGSGRCSERTSQGP